MTRKIAVLIGLIFTLTLASCGENSNSNTSSNNSLPLQKIVFTGASTIANGKDWNRFFDPRVVSITNRGVGGIESTELKNNIGEQVVSKPDKIFISIGTNNVLNRHEGYVVNDIDSMIAIIRAASSGTKIYIISMIPIKDDFSNTLIESLNNQISSLCNARGVKFIFIYNLFKSSSTIINLDYYVADGIHLNEAGYQVYADAIRNDVMSPLENGKSLKK